MHEYSIVQALLDQCEREAKKAGAGKVVNIVVKVGRLSGTEPKALKSAFDFFSEQSFCKGATLTLIRQNIVCECKECGETSELDEADFRCPKCNGGHITIIDGEELILTSIEMEQSAAN
ncbi:MAG: hydrogenase maturation nickel metallochaperone HypA [Helicobacteraceae bacterium]|jgi:hydrogenase nickel incorporation protein HypA/HybF|nr:hydrogenase maturation nickel metallochaperone HypA [Helicobacteraceae bacterium]